MMNAIGVRTVFGRRGVEVQQSYSSGEDVYLEEESEEQPWDQPRHRPSRSEDWAAATTDDDEDDEAASTPLPGDSRFFEIQEESLEDGDLPALSGDKGVGGRVVNGRRTTTRPIQPPSLAGLLPEATTAATRGDGAMRQQHQQFWAQLEDDDEDDDPAIGELEQRSYDNHNGVSIETEEGPDDEMRARRSTSVDWLDAPRHHDETEEYSYSMNTASGELETDYCSVALTALGNMCGGGFAVPVTPDSKLTRESHEPTGRYTRPIMAEKQEEHTAIEVEFVDPTPTHAGTFRKNALLAAMQRRAKESPDRSHDAAKAVPVSPTRQEDPPQDMVEDEDVAQFEAFPVAASPSATGSDMYTSFSTSDKRKFVKLINSGVSPADASTQIISDRNKDGKSKASTKVMAKLAFWKKAAAASQQQTSDQQDNSKEDLEDDEVPEIDDETNAVELPGYDNAQDCAELQQNSTDPFDEIERLESDEKALDFVEEKKLDFTPPRTTIASVATRETSSPESGVSSESRPFAKSGIDYYDGMRSSTGYDDDEIEVNEAANIAIRRHGALNAKKAFAKLSERSKSAPRSRLDDDDDYSSERQLAPRLVPRDAESFSAGILATSEAQGQRDTARVLPQSRSKPLTTQANEDGSIVRPEKNFTPSASSDRSITVDNAIQAVPTVSPDHSSPIQNVSNDAARRMSEENAYMISPMSTYSFEMLERADSTEYMQPEPVVPVATVDHTERTLAFDPVESKPPNRQAIQFGSLDVNMSTYMHASNAFDTPTGMNVGGHLHDNVSVYTIGTTMTGLSAVTTSTRSRRPGVAKSRIEREKYAQQVHCRKKGWHETMKAVSASTNRRWDPVRGWVGFSDNSISVVPDIPSGKIHLNLEKSLPHKKQPATVEPVGGEAVPVPFPDGWEKERRQMGELSRNGKTYANSNVGQSCTDFKHPGPDGWVESMQAASAVLAVEGKHWDSQKGWIDGSNRSNDINESQSQAVPSERDQTLLAIKPEGELVIDASVQTEESSKRICDARNEKLGTWVSEHETGTKNHAETSVDSSMMTESSTLEKQPYMQIGVNGLVRAETPPSRYSPVSQATSPISNLRVEMLENDRRKEPIALSNSASFPSMAGKSSPMMVSPATTNVVKQKIGAEDFELFPDDTSRPTPYQETEVFHHDDASSTFRRTVGPVDIDDIDQTWDEDEGNVQTGMSWEGSRRKAPDSTTGIGSGIATSLSAGSKPIPKLRSSKRDTSPINSRKNVSRGSRPSIHLEGEHASVQQDIDRPNADRPNESTEMVNAGAASLPNEKLLEVADEADKTSRGSQWVEDIDAISREETIVKERLKQWESRLGHIGNDNDNALASEEWKAFLGKKAAQQRDAMLADAADVDRLVSTKRAVRSGLQELSTESEGASLTYPSTRDVHFSQRGASSMTRNEKSSDFEQATSEYGPADGEKGSFFKRFVECTAPIRAECHAVGSNVQNTVNDTVQEMRESDTMPMAHLAFLRSNAHAQGMQNGSGRFVPPAFCGRQDNVVMEEEYEDDDSHGDEKLTQHPLPFKTASFSQQPRAQSRSRRSHTLSSSASSVVSADGFGAKTAYLEALALKGAVSNPKRNSSKVRGGRSSSSSVASGASSAHSEKWKSFLEKKKLGTGVSPGRSIANESDVSKAAGRYASSKLEEIMLRRNQPEEEGLRKRVIPNTTSVQAADELAAARVEAMMAALTSTRQLDEGEI